MFAHNPADIVVVSALLALVASLTLPRRFVLVLPALVASMLIVTSALASNDIATLARGAQKQLVGAPPDWIDRAAASPVAYVYDDETYWNGVYEQRFWNRRIDRAYTIGPSAIPGPILQSRLEIGRDGSLPLPERYVAAADTHTFVGDPIAHVALANADVAGLTLWRLDEPARLSTIEQGFMPNGDITASANVVAYDCAGGMLQLTLLPKATSELRILLDGRPVVTRRIAGLPVIGVARRYR